MKRIIFALFALSVLLVPSLASSGLTNAPRIHIKEGTSINWAGYAIETNLKKPQNNVVTDVKGSWVVPAVDCSVTPSAYSSFWIGIDGYSSNTVEQIGTESDCSSGSSIYHAWYEMYPRNLAYLPMTITPGHMMSAEVKYLTFGNFQLTIKDVTAGTTFSTVQTSNSAKRSSAEWVAEAPWSGGVLPLADFGTVLFSSSSATINGHTGTINDAKWRYDPITMTTSSGAPKATPSPLFNGGSSFSVAWNSAGP